jgi:CubicO group peptidase (beta-lactamase class C family)
MLEIHKYRIASTLLIILFLVGCASPEIDSPTPPIGGAIPTLADESSAYWPTSGWRTATPEQIGIDSALLADMLETIQEEGHNIHSLSVVRDGFLVLDVYFHPFSQDLKHIIHSCTKSISSALIGIAIEKDLIESIDQPLLDFFPNKEVSDPEGTKQEIRLEDLLTMSSGLDCRDSYLYNWDGLTAMQASDDWIQHMLNLPMSDQPGSRFEYCNGGSYLLTAIVQAASGMTALEFASQHLFEPLGIHDVDWPASPQGINIGWGDMRLKPLDMAKFGYLYLNQGRWEGEQILAPEWVAASTSAHIPAGTLSEGYGYQWWVDSNEYYMALGYAGQTIFVLPDQDMVVVFTSGLAPQDFFVPERLFNDFILPAVISSDPLPDNQPANERLNALVQAAQNPADAGKKLVIPDFASQASGKTYVFEEGTPFKEFSLTFFEDIARFQLTWTKTIEVDIGLDDNYRLTDSAGYTRAYKGYWSDDTIFHIDYQVVGYSENGSWEIRFENDRVVAVYREQTTGNSQTLLAYHQGDE